MLEASKAIWIDNDAYWDFDTDFYGNKIDVALTATHVLNKIVDKMRVALGHLPMFPDDKSQPYDCDGWYNFYVRLDSTSKTGLGNSILAIVESPNADDDYDSYDIHLTEDEQVDVYNEMDRQLKNRFDTSCEALLAEAKQYAASELLAEVKEHAAEEEAV
jgi:hypothetical protein